MDTNIIKKLGKKFLLTSIFLRKTNELRITNKDGQKKKRINGEGRMHRSGK